MGTGTLWCNWSYWKIGWDLFHWFIWPWESNAIIITIFTGDYIASFILSEIDLYRKNGELFVHFLCFYLYSDFIFHLKLYNINMAMQDILCNDCGRKGASRFHWLYHKCGFCGSYNTRVIKTEATNSDCPASNQWEVSNKNICTSELVNTCIVNSFSPKS